MLIAKNISKQVQGKEVLQDLSFSLAPGEIVSIIGPSGAGKTTFLKAISLIDEPDSGSLEIDTHTYTFPLTKERITEYPYPDLTVVFQQFFIWPHLTIKENLILALRGKVDAAHFDQVIALFQMSEFLNRYPNEVSLGQRQRAALVRALLLKPKYLLLDEVTSALDVEQSYLILSHLKSIASQGVGIIFVTHALHLASKISDKIIFLADGKIGEEGTSEILTSPKTERLKRFIDISQQVI